MHGTDLDVGQFEYLCRYNNRGREKREKWRERMEEKKKRKKERWWNFVKLVRWLDVLVSEWVPFRRYRSPHPHWGITHPLTAYRPTNRKKERERKTFIQSGHWLSESVDRTFVPTNAAHTHTHTFFEATTTKKMRANNCHKSLMNGHLCVGPVSVWMCSLHSLCSFFVSHSISSPNFSLPPSLPLFLSVLFTSPFTISWCQKRNQKWKKNATNANALTVKIKF